MPVSSPQDPLRYYDSAFASRDYQARYPVANPATLEFLRLCHLDRAREVLDLGCGNGRYAIPLAAMGQARVTACDPSREALSALAQLLARTPWQHRFQLVQGGADSIDPAARFDGFMLMFGVLGLLGPAPERVAVLRRLRAQALPEARLVLSVPSAWRRLPIAQLQARLRRLWQTDGGTDVASNPGGSRDVHLTRRIAGQRRGFTYHLYRPGELRRELAAGGWRIVRLEAESLLPESMVCRWDSVGALDGRLRPWLPAAWGYGMRALALPA